MKVDLNLWEWLMKAQRKLNAAEYLAYQQMLLAWLANDRQMVSFNIKHVAHDIGIDRHSLGSYLPSLQRKRWLKLAPTFNREFLLQWCRTSLDERVPTPHAPGVKLRKPDGTIVRIPVSQFAQFEKDNGLTKRLIEYMNRRIKAGKKGCCTHRETGDTWEVLEIFDYEFSSYPYSELFGQTKQQRAKANNWNAA